MSINRVCSASQLDFAQEHNHSHRSRFTGFQLVADQALRPEKRAQFEQGLWQPSGHFE